MIHFNAETRTFTLQLASTFYAFRVDGEGRLVHLAWEPYPGGKGAGSPEAAPSGQFGRDLFDLASFDRSALPYELMTYGDVTYHEVSLKVNFPAPKAAPNATPQDARHAPVRDLRLRYADHRITQDARPGLAPEHGLPTAVRTPRETLRVRLVDPVYPFEVVLCYRLTPEHDIVERWCEVANTGQEPVEIETLAFATLSLPNGTTELTSVSGFWAREFTAQREVLPAGTRIIESRTLQTGHGANPFFLLNAPRQAWEEQGKVYFGTLAFSGAWQIAIEQLTTFEIRLHAGYHPFDFRLVLGPDEQHTTPALIAGCCSEGWGGASRRLHAFACERVLPQPQGRAPERPVLYNSWEATYFNLSYEGQVELARKSAAIGVELFCVDDGWFGGRRNDFAGLGDWTVSEAIFPNGLEPLIEEVHSLGMQFGLWVEPEMVNPDSDLYRAHPDWVLHFPGRPRTEARNQLILDFGRPEVVEHVEAALNKLLDRYGIDFIKWDMNRNATEPGSAAGNDIWWRHAAAVYGIMDRLRGKHPSLQIESCSGGGGRIDLGILARTDQVWTSDNTDALDRIRIQEGFSLAYPARAMESWVTHAQNHQTFRISTAGTRFDVAMRGALGIGSSLNELAEEELAEYAAYIAFYKRIRHIVQGGRLYRLQRLEEYQASVIEYLLPDASEAVYSIVTRDYQIGWTRPPAPLKGLDPRGIYVAFDRSNQPLLQATGFDLMTFGIPMTSFGRPGDSKTLHLRRMR